MRAAGIRGERAGQRGAASGAGGGGSHAAAQPITARHQPGPGHTRSRRNAACASTRPRAALGGAADHGPGAPRPCAARHACLSLSSHPHRVSCPATIRPTGRGPRSSRAQPASAVATRFSFAATASASHAKAPAKPSKTRDSMARAAQLKATTFQLLFFSPPLTPPLAWGKGSMGPRAAHFQSDLEPNQ